MFPPILFFSTRLFWLAPNSPRPKLLLLAAEEDSPALKVLDDSRAPDLHIASVKDRDANAKHGIDFMTAAGWRGDGSRYCMSIQSQLDVIRSEGDTRICAGRCQRHRAVHIAAELAVIMKDQSGVDGAADVIGLCACATDEERKYAENGKG